MLKNSTALVGGALMAFLGLSGVATASTITGWNTGNVDVGATPPDGETGYSVVYDRSPADPGTVTNGRIAFTPPEAIGPGIQIVQETYEHQGKLTFDLDGCIMTSNPDATCTSEFQSGKRMKQQMTSLGPVDLVFDVESDPATSSIYQVFHRLINLTTAPLAGFTIELGFGVGDGFTRAGDDDGLSFSSDFRARPSGSGEASSQFPFGLFGPAASNENFEIDGFFAPQRAGFVVDYSPYLLESGLLFGPYASLFDYWLSQESVPLGALWDYEPGKDPLVMAWLNGDGKWELRRDFDGSRAIDKVISLSGAGVLLFDEFADVVAWLNRGDLLGADISLFDDQIEDLANLNVNFAIALDGFTGSQFTLRTTVAAIPLPATGLLLIGGLGALAALRRRKGLAV